MLFLYFCYFSDLILTSTLKIETNRRNIRNQKVFFENNVQESAEFITNIQAGIRLRSFVRRTADICE